jgi:hypothetical protein
MHLVKPDHIFMQVLNESFPYGTAAPDFPGIIDLTRLTLP